MDSRGRAVATICVTLITLAGLIVSLAMWAARQDVPPFAGEMPGWTVQSRGGGVRTLWHIKSQTCYLTYGNTIIQATDARTCDTNQAWAISNASFDSTRLSARSTLR